MHYQNKSIIFVLFLFLMITEQLGAQVFSTKTGYVQFLSEATVESFVGKSDYLIGEVNLTEKSLDFYVDVSTISTGIKLRDEHMRENHLETTKFPFIEFSGALIGFDVAKQDTQIVIAKGAFTLHGVTKNIEVQGKMLIKGNQLEIVASWTVKLDDYAISRPQFLFLKLSDEQKVSIKAVLKK